MTKKYYVIDQKGRKIAVILPIGIYKKMLYQLEDLQDTLELEECVYTSKGFVPYDRVRKRLKLSGKL